MEVAQKAYIRDKSYTAWLYGQYNATSFGVVMANSFAKKGAKPAEFPKWKDPVPKPPTSKERQEEKFRESQIQQNMWLHNMINN